QGPAADPARRADCPPRYCHRRQGARQPAALRRGPDTDRHYPCRGRRRENGSRLPDRRRQAAAGDPAAPARRQFPERRGMRALFSFLPLFALQKARFFRALALSLLTLAAGIALLGVSGWFLTAAALTTAGVAFNLFVPSAGVRGLSFVRVLSRYGERLAGH